MTQGSHQGPAGPRSFSRSQRRYAILFAILIAVVGVVAFNLLSSGSRIDPGGPGHAVPEERIRQTYLPGRTYESVLLIDLDGRGTNRDWGITVDTNFLYHGELQIRRKIESNDGHELVLVQTFTRAQNVVVATDIDNISFRNLGVAGELLLGAIDLAGTVELGLPPGWANLSRSQTETIMNHPAARAMLSKIASSEATKAMGYVDSLQGKSIRLRYIDGRGVQKPVEPIGCTLDANEEKVLETTSIISDTYVLPDEQSKAGDRWVIYGRDLMGVLDPSMRASLDGKLNVTRRKDEGRFAVIEIDRGSHLKLVTSDDQARYLGDWYPTGNMHFSKDDRIVTRADMSGDFSVKRESTNHWIFKAELHTQPKYNIQYTCRLLP